MKKGAIPNDFEGPPRLIEYYTSFDFTRTSTGNPATNLALMSEYSLGMPPFSSAMQEGQAATCVSSGMNRNMTSLSHFVDHHFSSTYFTSAANSNSNCLLEKALFDLTMEQRRGIPISK